MATDRAQRAPLAAILGVFNTIDSSVWGPSLVPAVPGAGDKPRGGSGLGGEGKTGWGGGGMKM